MSFWKSGFKRNVAPLCSICGYDKLAIKYSILNYKQETVFGDGNKKILIVADPRHLFEEPFPEKYNKSPIGTDLRFRIMPNIDIYTDCWIIPAMQCIPLVTGQHGLQDDKNIKKVNTCRPWLEKTIKELQPKVIILMGDTAIRTFYSNSAMEYISEYHLSGRAIPNKEFGAWVLPVLSFDDIAEKKNNEGIMNVFIEQVMYAMSYAAMDRPVIPDYDAQVKILTEYTDVVRNLEHILETKPEWLDFDYETNTLKSWAKGASLISASWTYEDDCAYSACFEGYNHWTKEQCNNIKALWCKIMTEPSIKKSAHNLHMEEGWNRGYLKVNTENWAWDSMVAAHLLDTRKGTKGLKFLTFVLFGFGPYNTKVKPYLESVDNDGINHILECPEHELLHYGGLDSLFGRKIRLWEMERMQIGKNRPNRIREAWETVYFPGTLTMCNMTINGFGCDLERYSKIEQELLKEQSEILSKIMSDPAVLSFAEREHKDFSVASNDDLRILLFEILGLTSEKVTKGGSYAVDAEVLEEIDIPVCKLILRWRKIEKVVGTFLSQYSREYTADNRIHPGYSLSTTRSGRSSSFSPNFQNIPKRDKWAKNIIRTALYPPEKGYRMSETDYSSLEIRVFTCHSQDPVLIDYLVNGGDMHRDEAVHVFAMKGPEQVHKEVRQCMKMGWNFALLYGSYYRACAIKMWEEIVQKGLCLADKTAKDGRGITIKDHLKTKGVFTENDFIWWCRDREKEFWEKFHVTYEYRQKAELDYVKKGYVETKFGFRRSGVLTRNQIINTPTQGTGSGMLTWSATELLRIGKKEGWRSMQNGQVHDSLVCSIWPDELQHVFTTQKYVMTKLIRERFDWIIVPLDVEVEVTPEVDMPWTELKPMVCENGVWQYEK